MNCWARKTLTIEYKIPMMNKYFIFYDVCHCRMAELVWVTSFAELTINSSVIKKCLGTEYTKFQVILGLLYSSQRVLEDEMRLLLFLKIWKSIDMCWENVDGPFWRCWLFILNRNQEEREVLCTANSSSHWQGQAVGY